MKVLVTGGLGFIGSHTVVELLNRNDEVVIVDNLYNASIEVLSKIEKITGKLPEFVQVDLLDKAGLEEVFKTHYFDAVIHFAGYKAVGESVSKPILYYQNNVAGSLNLYELMDKYHVNNVVFSSSATVYGDPHIVPIEEDFPLSTTNPYGTTKLHNERMLEDIAYANGNLSVMLLRYFNPIGAHKSGLIGEIPNGIPNNLVPYIAQVATGQRAFLQVYGNDYNTVDGTGVRDYIHVVDLAKGHLLALDFSMKNKGVERFNLGTGQGYSVLQVKDAYQKACGKEIPFKIVERRAGDIAECYADTKKAEEVLGFKTVYGIDEMCVDSWNFQQNLDD